MYLLYKPEGYRVQVLCQQNCSAFRINKAILSKWPTEIAKSDVHANHVVGLINLQDILPFSLSLSPLTLSNHVRFPLIVFKHDTKIQRTQIVGLSYIQKIEVTFNQTYIGYIALIENYTIRRSLCILKYIIIRQTPNIPIVCRLRELRFIELFAGYCHKFSVSIYLRRTEQQ